MGMHHCDKCWDNICTCGWNYRHLSSDDLDSLIEVLKNVYTFKRLYPNAKFGLMNETGDDRNFLEWMRK